MTISGVLVCLLAVAAVGDALVSKLYYRDYLHKRANDRVERIKNLPATLSKPLYSKLNFELYAEPVKEEVNSVKDVVTDVLTKFFQYTGGDYWYRSDFWTLGDPCTWYGITCNSDKEVVKIDLHSNNLTSMVPSVLTNITTLVHLDLSHNNRIPYQIPTELWEMENLEYLDLSYCALGGELPTKIAASNLHTVILTGNKLTGLLPSWTSCRNLTHLLLDGNAFNSSISFQSYEFSKLETLALSRNKLSGSFPEPPFGQMFPLQVLWLYENAGLIGPIPSSWERFAALEDLEIEHAQGAIPTSVIMKWENISYLSITNGELTGPVPAEIFCNSTLRKLRYISFAVNSLDGTLVSDSSQSCCGMPEEMDTVDFSSNYLEGNLPTCVTTGYVKEVYLHNNYFVGAFPYDADTSHMKNLKVLQVCDNTLSGSIPSYLASADTSSLRQLGLCYNQFSNIDNSLKDFFTKIKDYTTGCLLDHNPFGCPIPDFIPSYCNAACSNCNTGDQSYLCDECVTNNGCGWCDETNNCLEGEYNGPRDEYHCEHSKWVYGNPQQCF